LGGWENSQGGRGDQGGHSFLIHREIWEIRETTMIYELLLPGGVDEAVPDLPNVPVLKL
jgi:hypothetical protein